MKKPELRRKHRQTKRELTRKSYVRNKASKDPEVEHISDYPWVDDPKMTTYAIELKVKAQYLGCELEIRMEGNEADRLSNISICRCRELRGTVVAITGKSSGVVRYLKN